MSDNTNLRESIIKTSKAIIELQLLNADYLFYKNYEHQLRFMKIVSSVTQAESFTRADALEYVLSQMQDICRKKEHNKSKLQPYLDQVNKILTAHPFSSSEADVIGMDVFEYFKQAGAIFWELCNPADDKEISASLLIYIVGQHDPYMIYDFKEEELLKEASPTSITSIEIKPENPSNIEETSQKPIKIDAVGIEFEVDESQLRVSDIPLNEPDLNETSDVQEEAINEEGTIKVPATETIEQTSQETALVEASPERDAKISDIVKGDPELERLYTLIKDDRTFTGLIARELILAKGKIDK